MTSDLILNVFQLKQQFKTEYNKFKFRVGTDFFGLRRLTNYNATFVEGGKLVLRLLLR